MPVVACPKCSKKFKLSAEQLGKTVKCSSCQTKFKTAAPAAAKDGKPGNPKAKSKAKSKAKPKTDAAPPTKKTPKTLEDELFASAPLKPGAPDPLGNFVLEDPGFGALELPDPEDDDGDDSNDDMFANRKHLMENPALKDRNPYASPTGSGSKKGASADARKMRQRLLEHEEAVNALGFLQIFGGGLTLLAALSLIGVALFAAPKDPEAAAPVGLLLGIAGLMVLFSSFGIFVGWGLFKLKTWAKVAATVLLVPSLLNIPIGTAISGYFLWVLHNQKGKEVFSDRYRKAVAATPDLRPGRRLIIIVAVVALVVFLLAVGLAVFSMVSVG